MKHINVIYGSSLEEPAWNIVWGILGDATGVISYKILDHIASSEKELQECDAFIFLDMAAIYRDKPFTYINATDSEEDIIEKIQNLAHKLFSPQEEEQKIDIHNVETIIHEDYKSIEVDLDEISEEITTEEISKLRFNLFEIEVDGQLIRLTKEDILTLSKMQKLMKVYGYKIKKVIQ